MLFRLAAPALRGVGAFGLRGPVALRYAVPIQTGIASARLVQHASFAARPTPRDPERPKVRVACVPMDCVWGAMGVGRGGEAPWKGGGGVVLHTLGVHDADVTWTSH